MKTRNLLISSLFLATSASFLSVPAMAMPSGDCSAMGMHEGRGGQMRGEHMKQRQQKLHEALKLNPEQEKAWEKYQESFRDMKPGERPEHEAMAKLTAPERAEQMLEFSRKHQERMTQHVASLKAFYGTLSAEQKKVFDEQHMRPQRGERKPVGKGQNTPPPAN